MAWTEGVSRESRLLGFAALGAVILASAAANLLLKLGARNAVAGRLWFGVFAWQTLLGLASFGCGAIFYAWALKVIDLHVAQSVMAIQYVVIVLLAATVLGERVPPSHWMGMGLIAAGLYLCMR